MAMLGDPATTLAMVSERISLDQALATTTVKACNAAIYGLKSPVSQVHRAVTLLGFSTLKNMLMGYFMRNLYRSPGKDSRYGLLWDHSLATASLCWALAPSRDADPEETYLAGLVHDIGKLFLFMTFPKSWDAYQEYGPPPPPGDIDTQRELRCFGITHDEVGFLLLGKWGLAPEVVEPVRFHHHPTLYTGRFQTQVRTLVDANRLAAGLPRQLPSPEARAELARNLAPDDQEAFLEGLNRFDRFRSLYQGPAATEAAGHL